MLRVLILYMSGEIHNWNSPPNDRFFEKIFKAILFKAQSFFLSEIYWIEIGEEIFFSYIVLMPDLR